MPSPRSITRVALVALAACLCAANVWFVSARSLIPSQLHDVVTGREIRREKHPGVDDVFLLHLQSGRCLVVDERVFQQVNQGDAIRKDAWSRLVEHNGPIAALTWSSDAGRMLWTMPLVLLVFLVAAFTQKQRRAASA